MILHRGKEQGARSVSLEEAIEKGRGISFYMDIIKENIAPGTEKAIFTGKCEGLDLIDQDSYLIGGKHKKYNGIELMLGFHDAFLQVHDADASWFDSAKIWHEQIPGDKTTKWIYTDEDFYLTWKGPGAGASSSFKNYYRIGRITHHLYNQIKKKEKLEYKQMKKEYEKRKEKIELYKKEFSE